MILTTLSNSYKWSHAICSFVTSLVCLSQRLWSSSLLYHVSECPSILRMNKIALYMYSTFFPVRFPPPFGYCKNTAMTVDVQISVLVFALNYFEYIPRSWIAKSYCNSVFNLLSNQHAFCHSVAEFYILTSNEQGFQLFPILTDTFLFVCLFFTTAIPMDKK